MKRVLILPYYGTLPNYFAYWLQTAGYNEDYDFWGYCDPDIIMGNLNHFLSYIYLQKRKTQNVDANNAKQFYIIPNEIRIAVENFPNEYLFKNLNEENNKYHKMMTKNKIITLFKNLFKGNIKIIILSKLNFKSK